MLESNSVIDELLIAGVDGISNFNLFVVNAGDIMPIINIEIKIYNIDFIVLKF